MKQYLRRGVDHLVLDLSRVWGPRNEYQLVPLASVLRGEVQVEHAVAAFVRREASTEVVVGLRLVPEGVHHYLRIIFDLVDKVSVVVRRPVQLEGVEGIHRLIVHRHAGGL